MRIPDRIDYLLQINGWTQERLGWELGNEQQKLRAVPQWKVSRWKRDIEKPPRVRIKQIQELCYKTLLKAFESPKGFRYVCNLGKGYGNHYQDREDDALARLRATLTREDPFAPVGQLQLVVFKTVLPDDVRAQCFRSDQDPPRCFVILVPDDDNWRENVRDEIFAHILPMADPGFEVKDN